MSIESIDHLYVETPSFEASCAFWKGLGFKLVEQWEEEEHLACRLEAGNTYIVLAEAEKASLTVHFRVCCKRVASRFSHSAALGDCRSRQTSCRNNLAGVTERFLARN